MDHRHESEVACGDGGGTAAGGGEQLDLTFDLDGEQLIFSDDPFPLLPDFPCISSQPDSPFPTSAGNPCFSSSSSTSSSASSAWVFNSAASSGSGIAIVPTLSEERDVIDILNDIDILDPAFDPSLLFSDESMMVEPVSDTKTSDEGDLFGSTAGNGLNCLFGRDGSSELAEIFLEWLKSNKDSISREDLRNIKIKTATVESALRRLGSDKHGRAKLFKLILTWVQNHHLQKKRRLEHHQNAFPAFNQHLQFNPVTLIPNNNPNIEYNSEVEPNNTGCNTWTPYCHPSMMMNYAGGVMPYQFPGCPTGWTGPPNFGASPPPSPYLFPVQSTPQLPIPPAHYAVGYTAGHQMYPAQPIAASVPAPAPGPISATKEARKKRAQQRRSSTHSHNNNSKSQQQLHHHQPLQKHHTSCLAAAQKTQKTSTSKQLAVQPVPPAPSPPPPQVSSPAPPPPLVSSPAPPPQQVASPSQQQLNLQHGARHQGLKGDKSMSLLFKKVLKQSDVNGLGRIVLPKVRDPPVHEGSRGTPPGAGRQGRNLIDGGGIRDLAGMEHALQVLAQQQKQDVSAGEHRLNGLQEGDFIVIYSDTKCNKYLIKGIKVRSSEAQRAANRKRSIIEKVGADKSWILGSPSPLRFNIIDSDYDEDDDDDEALMLYEN